MSYVLWISTSSFSKDAILRDFATRILDRHLFGWIEDPSIEEEKQY